MPNAKENRLLRANQDLAEAIKCHEAGRLPDAEKLYRKVLKEYPTNQVVLSNLAAMSNQVGKPDLALLYCQQVLAINPAFVAAHNSMGNALASTGRSEEALACYRRALEYKPDYAEAMHNAAVELEKLGRSSEAITILEQALRINPHFAEAYNSLGISLSSQGRLEQAIIAYKHAIRVRPSYFIAFNNLGNALSAMDKLEEALACYREALRLKPDYYEVLNNTGNALGRLGRIEQAISAFRSALAINPGLIESLSSLTTWKQSACDWKDLTADEEAFIAGARRQPWSIDPFFLLSQNSTPADQLLCAQHFAKRAKVPAAQRYVHTPDPKERKLRIAYISGNFNMHPNSYLSVGLFERHDRTRFEVIGYSYGHNDKSDIRKRVEKSFDHFFDIQSLTYAEAAKKIRADGIDILIDRQGYTSGHRMGILAYRPAPIQVNYLGYPGSMGADYIDYVIADPFVVPMDQQPFFMEKIVHLPHCYQSTDNRQLIAEQAISRSAQGLPEHGFVFCCFNNTNKIRPAFFDIWMRLLDAVPGSVLWLLNKNKLVEDNLRREATARGIDPARLVFAPVASHPEHLARHRLADLFLDTLPYNAHTTASDALWAGLPLLTCVGNTFAGRVAGSILNAIGLPELVTYSLPEYEALALKLAREPHTMQTIRAKLKENRDTTALFDTALYTRHLEESYLQMWKLWQSRNTPQPIIVAP